MNKFDFYIESINGLVCGNSNYAKFDPLIVLVDLLDVAKGISNEDNYNRLADNFQKLFKMPCEGEDYSDYFEKMRELRKLVPYDNSLTFADLEKLKSFFGLKFHFEIVDKKQIADTPFTVNAPLLFGFCNTEMVLESGASENHLFIYRCYTMIDVPFSILHYLLLNEYKFRQCEHCKKIFAAKSFKTKYCTRNSPYKKYEHLKCWEAVDHIEKLLKKRKKSILRNLKYYYPLATWEFSNEYDKFDLFDEKKKPRCWLTLMELEQITNKKYVKEKWYRDEYK